jgi:branched-chain amino acid transport system permease protein
LILLLASFCCLPVLEHWISRLKIPRNLAAIWPSGILIIAAVILVSTLQKYPITSWDVSSFEISPTNYAFAASEGILVLPEPNQFQGISPFIGLGGIFLGGLLGATAIVGYSYYRRIRQSGSLSPSKEALPTKWLLLSIGLLFVGVLIYLFNNQITQTLDQIDDNWLFLLALLLGLVTVAGIGALMETVLIRPLYATPINQILLTLGVSAIGIEVVRWIWGNTEFTMPRPSLFNGRGDGCPAENLNALLNNKCSTVLVMGERIRTYNEIFVPIVGIIVLVAVWLLLQRTRLGMIIRAGVQDSQMVEALSINVRQVFTLVFALGVGLAALGGVIAAPSMGVSIVMGETLLLNALIALAIGGLTSYPGAAAGSLLVGMVQQFIIKYGQIGIQLPFMEELFKPTPPLVPASTVLIMVIILLLLPKGLFGRKE